MIKVGISILIDRVFLNEDSGHGLLLLTAGSVVLDSGCLDVCISGCHRILNLG